jgi:uracil-DNA glycosylase
MSNRFQYPQNDWSEFLSHKLAEPQFERLRQFVPSAYSASVCYPNFPQIFEAFAQCSFEKTKVVVIGQDPYHGEGQANGLCFSVQDGIPHPPSLRNIFKELESDVLKVYPDSGDLSPWAKQGVLLLNAVLTVEEGKPGSHQNQGWEPFTDAVIEHISCQKTGMVFLLWGGYAQKKARFIDRSKHVVLECGHPSPLSANRGYWFGNKHFSQVNIHLKKQGKDPIRW